MFCYPNLCLFRPGLSQLVLNGYDLKPRGVRAETVQLPTSLAG